jgi:hypothetical protein
MRSAEGARPPPEGRPLTGPTRHPPTEGLRAQGSVSTILPMSTRLKTLAVAIAAGVATFAAASHLHQASMREREGVTYMYDTPAERCLSKGVGQFADAGQWPRTITGQDARAEITQRCAEDVWAYGPDEPGAVQR